MGIDCDSVDGPGLPAISRNHVACRTCRSLRLVVLWICDIHDKLGVDVFVARYEAAGRLLALDRSAPTLSVSTG